ncbi:P-loop containing nucleoside triphosphate hydrolase protein [Xylaria longipes]|nr:P-loop containing nucleoside triphosphate hydrolase protein [Xylaria longipes]
MKPTQPVQQGPIEDKPKGPRIRYRVEHRHLETNELISHHDTEGPEVDDDGGSHGEAFVLVTTYKTRNPLSSTQAIGTSPPSYSLHLISPAIVNALRSVVQYYPYQDLTGDIVINWPYAILVHHYDELAQFRDRVAQKDERDLCEREKRAFDDLNLLLKYLDRSVMPEVLQERERNAKGYHTFEYMWVWSKPGTTMLQSIREDTEFHPQVIHSMIGGVFQYPPRAWTIVSWDMRYDGKYLGRYRILTDIDKFDGQEEIINTVVGDMENKNDLPGNVANQLNYGETYWRLLSKQCMQYKGKTQDVPSKEVDGLVMTDMKSYYSQTLKELALMNTKDCRNWTSDCKCEICKIKMTKEKNRSQMVSLYEDYNYIAIETQSTLTPHQYFLCHFKMPAFVFKTRTWGKFLAGFLSASADPDSELLHMRDFSKPAFDEGLVDHLVMTPQRKRILKALAKSFARTNKNGEPLKGEPWTADFIPGKGHGLIFLLHGRPGVGKTYTAECIAAFTKRPLMILTSSDIGTIPSAAEVNLTKHFKAAQRWGAVLLIDEADVFMERRSTADLVRNSLVAGFLRALEFYDGILFLTTNRVGSFDDAFISRVHIQLYYPDFDDDQRRQIWQTFIDKLVKERGDYMRLNIDAKDYIRGSEMRALEWNGREIRNAFQTAVSLAEYDAEKGEDGKIVITDEHLRAVVELSRDFKTYLNELHKGDEAKRAERKYERLDSYARS